MKWTSPMEKLPGYDKEVAIKIRTIAHANKDLLLKYGLSDPEGFIDFSLCSVGWKITDKEGEKWGSWLEVQTDDLIKAPSVILERAYQLLDELKKEKGLDDGMDKNRK